MGVYFDNLGRAFGPIKLGANGVWLSTVDNDSEKEFKISLNKDGTGLVNAYVKSPPMEDNLVITGIENRVATVEWVTWALNLTEFPQINLDKYNKAVEDVEELQAVYTALNSQINGTGDDSIVSQLSSIKETINSSQFDKLNALLNNTVILWGGNAGGWDSDEGDD